MFSTRPIYSGSYLKTKNTFECEHVCASVQAVSQSVKNVYLKKKCLTFGCM